MSRNVEIVGASYDASARGDVEGVLADLHPEARWTEMAGFPCAGTYCGPDDVTRNVFQRLDEEWLDYQAVPDAYVDGGDMVVVTGWYSGTYRATGRPMRVRFAHVWALSEGRIVGFEQFTDTLLVRAAME